MAAITEGKRVYLIGKVYSGTLVPCTRLFFILRFFFAGGGGYGRLEKKIVGICWLSTSKNTRSGTFFPSLPSRLQTQIAWGSNPTSTTHTAGDAEQVTLLVKLAFSSTTSGWAFPVSLDDLSEKLSRAMYFGTRYKKIQWLITVGW